MKRPVAKFFLLVLPVLLLGGLLLVPSVRETLGVAIGVLSNLNLEPVKEYLRSFGWWGPMVSFALMILQSVLAPLPAFLLTFANAALWGWGWGALLSWTSAMAGAAVCFAIARGYGRDAVAKLTSKTALGEVDRFFEKYGRNAVLVARLLPFVSFDLVSYAAGLTPLRWLAFLVATGLGQLPATLIYSYAGEQLTGGAQLFVTGLLVAFAIVALSLLLRAVFRERALRKEATAEKT